MRVLNIAPNVAGIHQLQAIMVRFAQLESMPGPPVYSLDADLRNSMDYRMLEIQSLRTPRYMMAEYARTGKLTGACTDFATLAAAMLFNDYNVASMRFVFSRFPGNQFAWHVFLEATTRDGKHFRIDPTAPQGADYAGAEILTFPVR